MSKHQQELDRHFAWFQEKLPPGPSKFVGWLRKPSARWLRIPIGLLLVLGGLVGFLPVLGFWMLIPGLLLLSLDLPFLRMPMRIMIVRSRAWFRRLRRRNRMHDG